MKTIKFTLIALATLGFTACGSNSSTNADKESTVVEETVENTVGHPETCTFNYDATATKISWKSFKTMAKVAVGGTFNTFSVDNTGESSSETAVFANATFSIVTASVNSGNTERDPKLIKFFFNEMVSTDTITGGIVKISEPVDGKGAAIISISMNGQTKEENAIYKLEGTTLTLSATINMAKWEASNAITALNNECKDLHTGDDGVSKLWEEVDIEITTSLSKDCN